MTKIKWFSQLIFGTWLYADAVYLADDSALPACHPLFVYSFDASSARNAIRFLQNYYLQYNGYPDTKHAEINIPSVTIEDSEANISKAQLLASMKTGTVNEIRELMGLEGISAEEIAKMQEEWKILDNESLT